MVPPAFAHERVKVYVPAVVNMLVLCEPLADFVPVHDPLLLLAVQLVGLLVADHVRFELPPEVTEIGLALMLTTGFGMVVTVSATLFA